MIYVTTCRIYDNGIEIPSCTSPSGYNSLAEVKPRLEWRCRNGWKRTGKTSIEQHRTDEDGDGYTVTVTYHEQVNP